MVAPSTQVVIRIQRVFIALLLLGAFRDSANPDPTSVAGWERHISRCFNDLQKGSGTRPVVNAVQPSHVVGNTKEATRSLRVFC